MKYDDNNIFVKILRGIEKEKKFLELKSVKNQ